MSFLVGCAPLRSGDVVAFLKNAKPKTLMRNPGTAELIRGPEVFASHVDEWPI